MQVCRWWSKSMRLELLSLFSDDDNSVEIRKGNHNRKISNWKHFNGNRKWKRKFQLPINYCLIIQRLWIHAYIYEFVWIPIPSYALSAHQSVPSDFLFFFFFGFFLLSATFDTNCYFNCSFRADNYGWRSTHILSEKCLTIWKSKHFQI